MRKLLFMLFVIFLINVLNCFSEDINIYKIDFFGMKLDYSFSDVKKKLDKTNKEYIIRKDKHFKNLFTIDPKDQIMIEGINLDYSISVYKDHILRILKFNIKNKYADYLYSELGKENSIKKNKNVTEYLWEFDEIMIKFRVNNNKKDICMLTVINKDLQNELKKIREKKNW